MQKVLIKIIVLQLIRKYKSIIRQFWYRLWIRKNEFHISLEIDLEYMEALSKEEQEKYLYDLGIRRQKAHNITLGKKNL